MITPLDIENKDFSKGVRGYKEEEVDDFLDLIIIDMEKLIKENKILKAEALRLRNQVDEVKGTESTVVQTLEAAKELMNDISASSERRAQVLLKNAELDAELIQREARESVQRYTDEGNRLFGRLDTFKRKYRAMLEEELERIDGMAEELFDDFEDEFLPASISHMADTNLTKREVVIEDMKSDDLTKTTAISRDTLEKELGKKEDLTKTIVNVRK